ncbi:ATP-binding cassette domain-containing protein [bacterium]|nr:ATP-binding cassette domain-containing protein [FCB group bacterium]MBL7190229.1 ATP-binding cassette domain-containing protein [bacterium]
MIPVIQIEHLSYTYPDGTKALHDISLRIDSGERVGIIGANGAGKSTLILHFNGLLQGEGKVIIDGIPLEKKTLKTIRRKIGLVFQNPDDQLFCPSVYDDIAFAPRNMGLNESEVRDIAEDCLKRVGLLDNSKRGSYHLSWGEKRRASIAAVLAMRPEILVLDEPVSGLDPRGKREIVELLKSIGGTQVMITHDLDRLKSMADRAVVMNKGRIIADDETANILSNQTLLYKAGLI